ncbi:MAG: hypothetical protein IH946_02785, partial [Bacteroidetes bacterium]|nr:hypothetical protein [Bacteroidota bacterium]
MLVTHTVQHYSIIDGLPHSDIVDIVQDRYGFIWLATRNGLCRFDGKQFTTYTIQDGLSSNMINCLAIDAEGVLWIGTNKGVCIYDGKTFKKTPFSELDLHIFSMHYADDSTLCMGTINGIFTLQEGNLEHHDVSGLSGITVPHIYVITKSLNGDIWAGSDGALLVLRDQQIEVLKPKDLNEVNKVSRIYHIYEHISGRMLFFYNMNNYYVLDDSIRLIETQYRKFLVGNNKSTLVSTTKDYQLVFLDSDYSIISRVDAPVKIRSAYKVYQDRENNLWIGTKGRGLFKVTTEQYKSITQGVDESAVEAIWGNMNGDVYFYSRMGILRMYSKSGKLTRISSPGIPRYVNSVIHIKGHGTYMGTHSNGVIHFVEPTGQVSKIYDNPDRFKNNAFDLEYDGDNLLMAVYGDGLRVYNKDKKQSKQIRQTDGLTSNLVLSVLVDPNRGWWVGTEDGLNLISGDSIRQFTLSDGLGNDVIHCLALDRHGNILIGTDQGLFMYDGNFRLVSNKQMGLSSSQLRSILFDDNEDLWLGTSNGINRLTNLISGDIKVKQFKKINKGAGISCLSNSVYKNSFGLLFFGITEGVIVIDPNQIPEYKVEPSLFLQQINIINDSLILDLDDIEKRSGSFLLNHRQNHLSFSFKGIS